MLRTVSAIGISAALAAAAMLLPAASPEVVASIHDPAMKLDRADHSPSCETQGWPYYETGCLRDQTRNAGRVPLVRTITTDKVQIEQPKAPVFEPVSKFSAAEEPTNPLSAPAWPEYTASYLVSLQTMLTR